MEFDISKLVDGLDFSTNHLVDCGNGLMLTNGEISTLKRFGINYLTCGSLKEILYKIDVILREEDEDELEELDSVAASIAERDYYINTHK